MQISVSYNANIVNYSHFFCGLPPPPVIEAAVGVVFEAVAAVLAVFVVLLHFFFVLLGLDMDRRDEIGINSGHVFINRLDSFFHDTNHVLMTPVLFYLLVRG